MPNSMGEPQVSSLLVCKFPLYSNPEAIYRYYRFDKCKCRIEKLIATSALTINAEYVIYFYHHIFLPNKK